MSKKEDLKKRVKRAERLAFLGALAGGLAHEIRNPLSTLKVNLQLLKEDWGKTSTPKEQKAYKKILVLLKETNRLEEILDDFLKFAKRHILTLEEHKLNDIIDEVLAFVEPELVKQNIKMLKHYDTSLPVMELDRNHLKQALMNIVINAQQAMTKGGELIVKTTREDKETVRIEIIDTGCGIPGDVLPQVFDVYFSTKKTGSGLGLATARRIIEEHNGTISVQSEPDKGSCFIIRLPLSGTTDEPR